jgi:hypothetical protein
VAEYPNWFAQTAQYNFEALLKPLAGRSDLNFLQLGVFTGDASLWLLENILTSESSTLTDVDTWEGSDEPDHKPMDFDDVWKTYLQKITSHLNVYFLRKTTTDYLVNVLADPPYKMFDFIYIDADHTTVGVLLDAELSWPLLKSGGIMAFDDYTWGHESGDPRLAPQVGIDLFLHRHLGNYELLTKNTQVWLRKK